MSYNLIHALRQATRRIQKSLCCSRVKLTVSLFVTLSSLTLLSNVAISKQVISLIESLDKLSDTLLASLSSRIYFEWYPPALLAFFILTSLIYLFKKKADQQQPCSRFQTTRLNKIDQTDCSDSTNPQPFFSAKIRTTLICALSAVFLVMIVLSCLNQPIIFSEFAIIGFLGTILIRFVIFWQYQSQCDLSRQISRRRLLDKRAIAAFLKRSTSSEIIMLLCLLLPSLILMTSFHFSLWHICKELMLIVMLLITDIYVAKMFMNLCIAGSSRKNTATILGPLFTGITITFITMYVMMLSLLIEFTNLNTIYAFASQLIGLASVLFLSRLVALRFESNWFRSVASK